MTSASATTFVYVTYIRTTPPALWEALTSPAFTKQYWFGMHQESDWTVGSSWRLVFADGRIGDTGEIIEADPPPGDQMAQRIPTGTEVRGVFPLRDRP